MIKTNRKNILLRPVLFSLPVLFLILSAGNLNSKPYQEKMNIADDRFENARANYMNFCAGCHGDKPEEYLSKKWMYGKDYASVFKSIKDGREEIGMPSFEAAFSDDEIRDISLFLLEEGNKERFYRALDEQKQVYETRGQKYTVDTIVTGFTQPWGMTWLPDGDMLITEQSGELYRFDGESLTEISGLPRIYYFGQGGLLDVELHPEYEENGWIYISYSYYAGETLEDGSSTALLRARLKNDQLVDQEILFRAVPTEKRGQHFGSRIEFDREGYLYLSVGDRGRQDNAQLLENHSGTVHRLNDDGSIPDDNPFVDEPGAISSIFTYGHRNIQGLAINPYTGEIWSHEHGPRGGDEINIERAGQNYGWPEITYGINYNGTIITEDTAKEGMIQPIIYWDPSIAPCGMDWVTGGKYPAWEGDLLVGSLRFKYVELCDVEGNEVVAQDRILDGWGRVRNVKLGPDSLIYVALEEPGFIVRLHPVND